MPRSRQLSFDDHRKRTGRGGPRPGAGRPRRTNRVHHIKRPRVPNRVPSHVTLRIRREIPSLRSRRFVSEFKRTLAMCCERGDFRVVHYSIQRDHVHMIVEAAGKKALACGMKSVASRIAFAVNRVFARRGPVMDGRFHLQLLTSRRQVRHAIAYVLLNTRKHWKERRGVAPPVRMDEASSGAWFDGWKVPVGRAPPEAAPVAAPRTWLLATGWRCHGLVQLAEVPGT